MEPCCEEMGATRYQKWLETYDGFHAEAMTDMITSAIFHRIPVFGQYLHERNVTVLIANSMSLINANTESNVCSCGKMHHLVVISSRLLFLIWRIMMSTIRLIAEYDQLESGMDRYRFREPSHDDLEQINRAIQMYILGTRNYRDEGIPELVSGIDTVPGPVRHLFLEVLVLGELFVVVHEVAHVVKPGNSSIRNIENTVFPVESLPKKRHNRWTQEIMADCDGAGMLFFAKRMYLQGQHHMSENEANELAAQLVFAGCKSAFYALFLAERMITGNPQNPATSGAFSHHPPISVRRDMFTQWADALAKKFGIGNPWRISDIVLQIQTLLISRFRSINPQAFGDIR